MTQRNDIVIAVFLFLLTTNFTSYAQGNDHRSISFIQGDSSFKITNHTDSINLERKPFAIRYFGRQYDEKNEKFYSAQIAILENPVDTLLLAVGNKITGLAFFEPGTGMAPGENDRYNEIFITNEGHHYLLYESDKAKRVDLVSKKEDILELEWKISAAFYENKDVPFSDLKLSSLYFVVFIDSNLNEIIDVSELKVIKITFR